MKIALVCDWFLPRIGGIELHLRDLASELRAAGHEVQVITSVPGDPVVDGTTVHRLRAPRLPRAGVVFTPAASHELRQILERERFDVVHAHVSIVSPVAFAGARVALALRTPTVVTFHSVSPVLGPLFGAVDTLARFSRWPAVFTGVSSMVAEQVRRVSKGHPVHILPNGIYAERWRPTQAASPHQLTIVSTMRLNSKKRPYTLLRMMAALVQKLPPECTPHLRIAGDGPERARIERAIARMSLTNSAELMGWQSRESLHDILAAADIFVLPSELESFGIAALEARCAGVPVVAMQASGVRDVITHGREGLLAASEPELIEHVLTLARDHELRASIAHHNLTTAPASSWATVIPAHIELYAAAQAQLAANH